MVEVRWLEEARLDLKDIFDYIARDSRKYAQRQTDKILQKTEILTNQIRAGRIVEELSNPSIREIMEGRYRIIYRIVNEQMVHILMIHHSARDLSKRVDL